MPFMNLYITQKGALYSADCAKCGATVYSHEWVHDDHNERRDAMQAGTCACDNCSAGRVNPETFFQHPRKHYAGRYSADGYLDCTEWNYSTNRRDLARMLRSMFGE